MLSLRQCLADKNLLFIAVLFRQGILKSMDDIFKASF